MLSQNQSFRKYNNRTTMYRKAGYDSAFESQVAMVLDEHLAKGTLKEVEKQVAVSLTADGEHICDYKVDFRVVHAGGRVIWIEAKGFATADWRLKKNLMERVYIKHHHPDEEYLVVTTANFAKFDKGW